MADGFLGRWSQRKHAVRAGQSVPEPHPPVSVAPLKPTEAALALTPDAEAPPPAPTLDDVGALTQESSFARFVGRDVPADVRNAAMKKLFTDPHYNVMDRLDIYIDDYSQPSPLPLAMLQKMDSAQFLNLLDEPEAGTVVHQPNLSIPSVSPPERLAAASTENHHDNIDLRLQPDHAPVGSEPGRSAE